VLTENWNKIADQKNLTEGPTWINGKGLLYSECSASLTWFWNCNKKTNVVWRNNTGGSNGMILDVKGKLYACEGEGRRVVSYSEGEETEILSESYDGMPFNYFLIWMNCQIIRFIKRHSVI
jgi:sugar lactone lactonase YvrE